jgi:methyltransferase (TIGR00027 family)
VYPLDAVERTAFLTAALRAAESQRADRLYHDPFAARLAGTLGPELLDEIVRVTFPQAAPRTLPSTPDYNAIRTRLFDDWLLGSAGEIAEAQVVIAPAGLDSRAFRLTWPAGTRVFEVDRKPVLDAKSTLLGDAAARVDRIVVPADMVADDWTAALSAAGYDDTVPSVWLLEGLLYYIPERDVQRILRDVAGVTAPGSRIAADVVNEDALRLPHMRGLLDVFQRWGCPWLFGTNEPEDLFAPHGFEVTCAQPGDADANFGRWPDPVPPRGVEAVRRVFFVRGHRVS